MYTYRVSVKCYIPYVTVNQIPCGSQHHVIITQQNIVTIFY